MYGYKLIAAITVTEGNPVTLSPLLSQPPD